LTHTHISTAYDTYIVCNFVLFLYSVYIYVQVCVSWLS